MNKKAKQYRLLFDGCDILRETRFDSYEDAEEYLKAKSPRIWRLCQYQIDITEVKDEKC